MKRILILIPLLAIACSCGERQLIETGEVAKVLTINGLEEGIRPPGAVRLPMCGNDACPKLVRLQITKGTYDLTVDSVFLPESNVDISNVRIGVQFQVRGDEKSIDLVFQEVRPVKSEDNSDALIIKSDMIWSTYLQRTVPDAVIEALRGYTVDQILGNVGEIRSYVQAQVAKAVEALPVEITQLSFPNGVGDVPTEVLEAKRKLYAIDENKAREIRALEAELAIEEQRQAVQRTRMHNYLLNAQSAGMSVSRYMELQALDRFADAAQAGTPVGIPLGISVAGGNG